MESGVEDKTVEELIAERQWTMFYPMSKAEIFLDYPELARLPEFMALAGKPAQLRFVWFFACKASRARELHNESDRIRYAVLAAWDLEPPKDVMAKYLLKKWPPAVSAAIEVMRGYELEPRIIRMLSAQKMLRTIASIVNRPAPDARAKWSEVGDYLDALKKAEALNAELAKFMEPNAFGVTVKKKEQEEQEGAIMERLHSARVD